MVACFSVDPACLKSGRRVGRARMIMVQVAGGLWGSNGILERSPCAVESRADAAFVETCLRLRVGSCLVLKLEGGVQ